MDGSLDDGVVWSSGGTVCFASRTRHALPLPCVTSPQNKCVSPFASHGQYFPTLGVHFHLSPKKVLKTQLCLHHCS